MTSRVSAIVRCGHLARLVLPTLTRVEQQHGGRPEIVLLTDDSTSPGARAWIAALATARGFVHVHNSAGTPGAIRNAGVAAVQRPYVHFIDAGDLLDRSYHAACSARLDAAADATLVTSGLLILGPGAERTLAVPTVVDIPTLVANPEAVNGAAIFRLSAWRDVGGFDEALPALEDYGFWLKLLEKGGTCAVVDAGLVVRPLRKDGLYRRAWSDEHRSAAMDMIARRHPVSVGSDPAKALFAREQRLRSLGDRYRAALAQRDETVAAIEELKARRVVLVGQLAPDQRVDLGDLRRTTPVSHDWGYERGTPVDRHYIEEFLGQHAADVKGAVLEVQEPDYTRRFGDSRVTRSDVVDLDSSNARATIVADLRCAPTIPDATYDCIILTQTLHVIDDMEAVVAECARILKPGGVVLATLPCASRVSVEYGYDGDFWRVTDAGARRLFGTQFPASHLRVESRGNVLVNTAFLYGLGGEELTPREFEARDPYFPMLVTVRAVKPGAGHATVLLYHRVASPPTDVHRLSVAPADFREQMAYVRDHCHPMSLVEFARAAANGTLPSNAVAVTFDDGYLDNLLEASPVLSEFGIPATFFVTTERLEDPAEYEYWWDALERILLTPGAATPDALSIDLPDGAQRLATRTDADRLAAHWVVYHAIVGAPADVRNVVMDALRQWSGRPGDPPTARRMNRGEVIALAGRPGHAIGAHSVKHLMLPRQPSAAEAEDVACSRQDLEALVGRPVDAFAYPFGAWDAAARDAVRDAGFHVAVACDDGAVRERPDVLALPRRDIASLGSESFGAWLRQPRNFS